MCARGGGGRACAQMSATVAEESAALCAASRLREGAALEAPASVAALLAADAPEALAEASWAAAAARGALARRTLHRPAESRAHGEASRALDAEAATFALLGALYASEVSERRAAAAPGATTAEAAAALCRSRGGGRPGLWRAARAAAWLEGLARRRLELVAAEAGVTQPAALPAFVWGGRDHAWAEDAVAKGGGGVPLDPDGWKRQAAAADGALDEAERCEGELLRGVWMFMRCGMAAEAMVLCELGGQPWRAASLAGCGLGGPTPLGDSALAAVVADAQTAFAEEMDGPPLRRRRAAKRAALAASRALAAGADVAAAEAGATASLEAALYGAMSANLGAMLPACLTWEEAAWARLKCWVDLGIDDALEEMYGGEEDVDMDGEVAGANASWPVAEVRVQLPGGDDPAPEIFRALADEQASGRSVAAESSGLQRVVQRAIIIEDWAGLVEALSSWLAQDDGSEHQPGAAERARFAAHLVFALRALARRLEVDEDADEEDASILHFARGGMFATAVDDIATRYVVHLIEDERCLLMVPAYLAWMSPELRDLQFALFLGHMHNAPLDAKRAVYDEARPLFEASAGAIGSAASGTIRAVNEARYRAPPGAAGVALKAAAGEWLVCAPELHAHAMCYAVAVLRELALGGESSAAAMRLLDSLVEPAMASVPQTDASAAGSDDLMEADEGTDANTARLTAPEDMDVFEAEAWRQYFECQAALEELAEVMAKRGDPTEPPSPMWAEAHALAAGAALAAAAGVLGVALPAGEGEGAAGGGWLVFPGTGASPTDESEDIEMEIVLAAPPGAALDAVRAAADAEAARVAHIATVEVLHCGPPVRQEGDDDDVATRAAAAGRRAGALCEVRLAVRGEGTRKAGAAAAAAAVGAAALKALPGSACARLEATPRACARAVCRAVLLPCIALATLKVERSLLEVAAAQGGDVPRRAEQALSVAQFVADDAGGLLALFTRDEIGELLKAEQECAVLAMR